MQTFRNMPIQRKLTALILLTNTAALLLACGAFVLYETRTFRSERAETFTVLADVLATNSTGALSFESSSDAEEVLAALKAEPDIVAAALYGADNHLFASYVRNKAEKNLPREAEPEGRRFEGDHLLLWRPVVLNEKRIGTICLEAGFDRMYQRAWRYAQISGGVLLASLLLALAISVGLQRIISRPVLRLADTARLVSEKKDYSVRAKRESGDEIGLLTDAFNQMLSDIEERSRALEKANESLQTQAAQLTESVGVLGSSARQILDFTGQVATSATETATAVTETTTTVEQVRHTSQVSSEKAKYVADASQKTAEVSQRGKRSVEETIAGMTRIRQQMESIAQSIVKLSEQSQAIGEIIAVVDDLSQQSNLLAVNASIEAAKAGEHGKGFAIVAQEVRSLAEQSKEATAQVRGILSDIQKATSAAVMATEQGTKAVEAGVQQSTGAGESISKLTENIAQAAQAATQIAATSQQQFVGMDQVASAMENIKQASNQTVESTRQAETAAHNLHRLGEKLKELITQFKV